jgi:hypothetical protein
LTRRVFFAAFILLAGLGLLAQFRAYAGPDTGFLLDEASRILRGDRLYLDLVDMNPPLIVLLNLGAVLLARACGIAAILAYRLGCTVALLGLLVPTAWLLRRVLPGEPARRRAVLLLLVFALFTLPGQDFGEREHLLLALALPYLLLAAIRAAGRDVPTGAAVLIGALAGAAFALKPPFGLLWLAVESWLRLGRRVPWTRVLPETVGVAAFLAVYTAAILLWAPDYFRLVALLAAPYTRFLYVPFWELLVRGPGALLTLLAALAFLALRRQLGHPALAGVFALGAVVCLVAGAAQQKGFSYHFYPASALAVVGLGTVTIDRRGAMRNWVGSVYRVIAVSVFATVVAVVCARDVAAAVRPPRDPEQQLMERLLPVVQARGSGQGVYVMSYNISSTYPLLNYAGARSASRFAQLWILPAAYMEQLRADRPLRFHAPAEMSRSERFLNQGVLADLRERRPKLLVVLQHGRDVPANGFRRLDYLAYFGRDPAIARELARYQLVADLGDFEVFERLAAGAPRSGRAPAAEPGTRDVIPTRSGVSARLGAGDLGPLLPLLAFLVSAILAARGERAISARPAPDSA